MCFRFWGDSTWIKTPFYQYCLTKANILLSDIMRLSKAYLNSNTPLNDNNLEISGCTLVLIVIAKFNLMISYPPSYSREIYHYREANPNLIRRKMSNFNWENAFCNTNVTKKVFIFSIKILNVLGNYIPHETETCDDKDLPWFNSRIKSFLQDSIKISFTKTLEGVTLMLSYLMN